MSRGGLTEKDHAFVHITEPHLVRVGLEIELLLRVDLAAGIAGGDDLHANLRGAHQHVVPAGLREASG